MNEPVDCLRCRHYFVTWDAALPRGCRAFGIKSAALPSLVIARESGQDCQGFDPKPLPPQRPAPPRDRFA